MKPIARRSAVALAALFLLAALLACGIGSEPPTPTPVPPTATPVPPTPTPTPTSPPKPTAAPTNPPRDVVGNYSVEGTNPDGSIYSGTLNITQTGDVYTFVWTIGGSVTIGTGFWFDPYVAVGWPGDACSTAIYAVEENRLTGVWVDPGSTQLGSETAVWLNADEENAEILSFSLEGTNPDGSTYTGGMALTLVGEDLFVVAQSIGDLSLQGTGLAAEDIFAVSYGQGEGCAIGLYEVGADGSLSGLWGDTGLGTTAGTENAVKQ